MLIDTRFYLKKAYDFNTAWKDAERLLENPAILTGKEHRYYLAKADFMRQQKNNCQIMAIRQAFLEDQQGKTHQLVFYQDNNHEGEVYSLSMEQGNRCHIPKSVLLEHLAQEETDFIFSLESNHIP